MSLYPQNIWAVFNFYFTRKSLPLSKTFRARALTTVPDSTSQKFMLVGQLARKDQTGQGRYTVIYLDFAPTRTRQCGDDDFERWYARSGKSDEECLMGHKQWYRRRRPDRDCYVGHKFDDPVEHEENCPCTDADFEWYVGIHCFASLYPSDILDVK